MTLSQLSRSALHAVRSIAYVVVWLAGGVIAAAYFGLEFPQGLAVAVAWCALVYLAADPPWR